MYSQYQMSNIDRQIEELNRLKLSMQQAPINNIINTSTVEFEAKMVKENEDINNILVQHKTAFIDLHNSKLSIKELDGTITTYDIIIPKTKEELEIEQLKEENTNLIAELENLRKGMNNDAKLSTDNGTTN